ncbi:putative ammonium transporter 3 isoform X2 [Halyomorpha halys]|uniref:putative ammonium transporter 3 isoform X2 n=1 Tax=Halyomorpha halys TaxID=286706 RepID=UPI0034D32840
MNRTGTMEEVTEAMPVNSTISSYERNETSDKPIPSIYNITFEDSNWIMTAAFIIFTMQTGFGMLESGCVSRKNEMNIMMKNVVDIFLGGITYWAVGYGMIFGQDWTCPVLALGDWFLDSPPGPEMGPKFTAFLFQLSFATTATTIVSGAMAERCNFKAYCLFSLLNTVVYCVPAGWVWGDHGFLRRLGNVDIAGSGPVHLVGGVSAFASALALGPRLGRYDNGIDPLPLGTPVNCAMGLFVLWWGWLAFNSGSTYGVSGAKWAYAAKAAVMTMISSFGGGVIGLLYSLYVNDGHTNILHIINSVLGSLVSVTAGCYLYTSIDAFIIGSVGALLTSICTPLFDMIRVDDPVGATAVHGISGVWGVVAVGLFAENPYPLETTSGRCGVVKGCGSYLLGIQALAALCLATYSFISSYIILWCINKVVPIRMLPHEELLGADLAEHLIRHTDEGVSKAIQTLLSTGCIKQDYTVIKTIGSNPGHESYLETYAKEKTAKQKNEKQQVNGHVMNIVHSIKFAEKMPNLAWID